MTRACEIRFTRYYDAPPDEVWAALTERDALARWLAPSARVELVLDGRFDLQLDERAAVQGRVRAVERGRVLELDWVDGAEGASIVRFELTPDGDGTVLVLDHRRVNADVGMRWLARWERRLEQLDAVVEGTTSRR